MATEIYQELATSYGGIVLHWDHDATLPARDEAARIAFTSANRDELRRRLFPLQVKHFGFPRIMNRETFLARANATRRAA